MNSKSASINGTIVIIEVPPVINGERAMVPLTFIAEALGAEVKYQQQIQTSSEDLVKQKNWGIALSAPN